VVPPENGAVFSLSPIKIMVIIAVVLLLLGPDKLPDVAHKLGSGWRALKRIQERVEAEVREVIPDLPSSGDIARIARSPVNLLNQLADRVDEREESAVAAASAPPQAAPDSSESEAETPLLTPSPTVATPTPPAGTATPSPPDPSLN
jgi:TatA/E family protein of Tat protein translocase